MARMARMQGVKGRAYFAPLKGIKLKGILEIIDARWYPLGAGRGWIGLDEVNVQCSVFN